MNVDLWKDVSILIYTIQTMKKLFLSGLNKSEPVIAKIIPFDIDKPMSTSGIRLGTPASTEKFLGMLSLDILEI